MADSIEETGYREIFLFIIQYILDAEIVEEVSVALAFNRDGVPKNGLRSKEVV